MTPLDPGAISQTIVVVDDDPAYLAMIQDFLSEEGYARVVCVPGDGAEEIIRLARPSVVLLDIHPAQPLAELRLLDRLRREPPTANTPVIICTTNPHIARAQLGDLLKHCCQILEKPFRLEDLLACIQAQIGPPKRAETA